MTIKRIISALLVVVLGVAFVVPSFALTPAEDSGEIVGIDDVNGDFVPADEVWDEGIMPLVDSSLPSFWFDVLHFPSDFLSYTVSSPCTVTDSSFYSFWQSYVYDSSGIHPFTLFLSRGLTGVPSNCAFYVFKPTSESCYAIAFSDSPDLWNFSVTWSVFYFVPDSLHSNFFSEVSSSSYKPMTSSYISSLTLRSDLLSNTIAASPSAVQSLAGALAEAGLGGSDPNEIWGQSLVANNHIYVTNGSYSLGNFTAAGALDNLMNNIAYSVPFGLTGTLVNVNGIYPVGTHDGPTVSVGSVSTSPLQALLDAIIYSPLTTAKRWVWNGSLEPPTLESTSTITESQAMAENFHSLGVFLNNENTAIKSLISSEVGYGSFDLHEITSDGVVTTSHENVGSIVGALSVMSNDITGMLSNLGFVLADPDDVKLKQDTKEETEAATDALYGENGLSKSDNFKQSNDLGSVGGILTPQFNMSDIAGATDNENLWAWFSESTWSTAVSVPAALDIDDDDVEPLYEPDRSVWGAAEWVFGERYD